MKKVVLSALAVLAISAGVQAQIATGSVFTGVDLNYGSNTGETTSSPASPFIDSKTIRTDFSINPGIGYFVAEDFAIGINLGYSMSKLHNTSQAYDYNSTSNGISFMPYARRYFNLGEKAAFFAQLNVGYTSTWGEAQVTNGGSLTNEKNAGYIFGASIVPGLSYFISNKIELDAGIGSLGYSANSSSVVPDNGGISTTNKNSNFGLNLSMATITFGFKYYLKKS